MCVCSCFQSHQCHTCFDAMFNVNDVFVAIVMKCLCVDIFVFHFFFNVYKFFKVAKSFEF